MSEDVGYMSDDLEWACAGSSGGSAGRSNWMGITSMVIGLLALGTAIYAALPRETVDRASRKVKKALQRGAQQARSKSQEVMEGVATAVHSSSPSGQ